MAIAATVTHISAEQAKKILSLQEGHFADLKAIEVKPAKLTQSLSAFANADGGELYIGIDELAGGRRWRGFADPEDANGFLQAFNELFPLGHGVSWSFLATDPRSSGLVLQVAVEKSRDIVRASDKIPYVRLGAQNRPVSNPEALEQLKRNKGITSFETETVSTEVTTITNSLVIIQFMLEVIPTAEPEAWLRKQSLIIADKPTVAGVLLFADEPQAALPKRSSIKIYRYKTTAVEGTRDTLAFDPITIEGSLYDQIAGAVSRTVELIEDVQVLGPTGLQSVQYPNETLHEIITNAVLHRDYAIADDVHVRIFDNRVEVESPGRLPAHITPENILAERFARNGGLVRLINKFPDPPNKDVGEGLNTAFDAMRKLKLKPPEITERANSVVCFIRHERLASPEELILEYLEDHDEINNRTVRELASIGSENKVKTIFQRMMKAGVIERVPGKEGASAAYRKSPSSKMRRSSQS
jgi:ATP-dependent DNA helicase RecG